MRIGIYSYFYFEILNRHALISPLNAVIAGSSRYISQGNVRLEFQEVIGYCVTTRFRLFLRIFAYSVTWRIELLFTFLALIHGLICSHERQNQLNVNLTISVHISKRNFFQEILLETNKKFNFITFEGWTSGKNWNKMFLEQFLADFTTVLSITKYLQCVK